MRFLQLFRFEVLYQLRHFSTWLLIATFSLFVFRTLDIAALGNYELVKEVRFGSWSYFKLLIYRKS